MSDLFDYAATVSIRPFHESDGADLDTCGICRFAVSSVKVVLKVGWHVVGELGACSLCLLAMGKANTEATHTPKPAVHAAKEPSAMERHIYDIDHMSEDDD